MNGVVAICAILLLFIALGVMLGLVGREHFSLRWLLAAAGLVALNDVMLTGAYGLIPDLLPHADFNWQGKVLALAATLAIASLPAFGWRRVGLTLKQEPGSLKASIPVAILYCAFFAVIALIIPNDGPSTERIAFQLTMPGLEEESFYRGILLYALYRAFTGRVRFLGVDWAWGAVLSCLLFGMAHAFGYSNGQFSFDPMTMALTAVPAFLAVWLRLRTQSLLLPLILHNFGNSILLLL